MVIHNCDGKNDGRCSVCGAYPEGSSKEKLVSPRGLTREDKAWLLENMPEQDPIGCGGCIAMCFALYAVMRIGLCLLGG